MRVNYLAWKHRRERPIIKVATPFIGADAVPEVTVTLRAQWDSVNYMQEDNFTMSCVRAFFARSAFHEDSDYLLIIQWVGPFCEDQIVHFTFDPEMRLIHDSVFTTLTAEAFAAEMLSRERFPLTAEIIVRLRGLVGGVVTPGCH